ncbi:MAG: C-GCAxxG-C-C family protein [Clostridia bacterium]|nr:C-GCAxxG-C-C family protein [Clostridia bacterium]
MKKDQAVLNFENGCNCSQAVLCAFCEELDLGFEKASEISVAFGGGVGRQGKMCGCISGGLMVLGLKYGNGSIKDVGIRTKCYDIAKDFCKKFKEVNGGFNCVEIIKYNLDNVEERKKAQEENVFKTRCSRVVAETIKLLENFI